MAKQEDAVRRLRFWAEVFAGVIFAVAVAAFTASTYLGSFAHSDELHAVENRVTATETKVHDIDSDMAWMRDQLIEISRAVNAPVVPSSPRRQLTDKQE